MSTDFGYESYKKLKEEMRPENGEAAQLKSLLVQIKKSHPIGATVKINGTGYTGKIVSYNEKVGGFYPGIRYPIHVEIVKSKNPKFEKAVGCVFEYTPEQVLC